MYRLFSILSIATGLSAGSLALAQQPPLESTVVEKMQPTNPALARDAKPEPEVISETPPAYQPAEPGAMEFTFLEDAEQPANDALSASIQPAFDLGIDLISFDDVFQLLPYDDPSSGHSETAPSVAVVPVPAYLAGVPRLPLPVDGGTLPTTQTEPPQPEPSQPEPQGVLVPPDAMMVSTAPEGEGVQPTAALEEADDAMQMEEVIVLSAEEVLPMPASEAVEVNLQPAVATCDVCQDAANCSCRSKRKCWQALDHWWHNTDLHRNHIKNLGDPAMFCERPFGVCNEGFSGAMIAAGKADRAMLHHYDFVHHSDGAVELTARGQHELKRIAQLMAEYPVPLLVESTHQSLQDEARRMAVISAVSRLGLAIAPDSIHVSADPTIGLSGIEAQAIQTIRLSESATGASRTRPYSDSSGATVIPLFTNQKSDNASKQ